MICRYSYHCFSAILRACAFITGEVEGLGGRGLGGWSSPLKLTQYQMIFLQKDQNTLIERSDYNILCKNRLTLIARHLLQNYSLQWAIAILKPTRFFAESTWFFTESTLVFCTTKSVFHWTYSKPTQLVYRTDSIAWTEPTRLFYRTDSIIELTWFFYRTDSIILLEPTWFFYRTDSIILLEPAWFFTEPTWLFYRTDSVFWVSFFSLLIRCAPTAGYSFLQKDR